MRFKPGSLQLVAALCLAFVGVSQAASLTLQVTDEWVRVSPAGEGFSVSMPLKPEEATDSVPYNGNTYLMRMYTASPSATRTLYMVVMQELGPVVGTEKTAERFDGFMKGFKEGLAKELGTAGTLELKPERDFDLKGTSGRQYALSVGGIRGLVRAYDAKYRIYVVMVVGADAESAGTKRFLDSFEIKDAPAPVPKPITK